MVKFSKELDAQLIPEWKDAFVNYKMLKKQIKKIKFSRAPNQQQAPKGDFGRSIFCFFGLVTKMFFSSDNKKQDIIQVRKKTMEDHEVVYETELAQLFSEEDEVRVFFARLDEDLNKVNQFYRNQECEFLERGEMLSKQLQILLDLKQLLSNRRRKYNLQPSQSSNSESFGEYDETNSEISLKDEVITTLEKNGLSFVNSTTRGKTKNGKPTKMAIRIDIPATTPTRAVTAATTILWEDIVNSPVKEGQEEFINKRKIQFAEKMIRSAFVELYKGLGLLKTYSSLNMMAFSKILKKFDKVACQTASPSYLKEVKRSHFISSDKVVRLMDEVESIFIMHFASNDRKKAMKFLKPQEQKSSHMTTFLVGLCTGCFVSLFCVYAILAHMSGIFSPGIDSAYILAVYPVFSVFALFSLHVFMYGCNLYMWKSTRINHNFIFDFSSSTAIKHGDAFLIGSALMTVVGGALGLHFCLRASGFIPIHHVETFSSILLLIFMVLLICPFDICYRSTRFCFFRIIRNIVCSPFYKVLLVDFFMADQLTSQIPLLRHLETTCCHILATVYKTHHPETCHSEKHYIEVTYVISFLPYFWRAAQCGRRYFDERDVNHLANMGKYVSAMVAAVVRYRYVRHDNGLMLGIVITTSVIATFYQLYWDFVKDWGLLNRNSRNPWLRDELILKHKSIYYISIALNFGLRVTWVKTVLHHRLGPVETKIIDLLLASLEVARRGHWNFYRLENEHLNNVGHFRAVRTVPLPFREVDSDG